MTFFTHFLAFLDFSSPNSFHFKNASFVYNHIIYYFLIFKNISFFPFLAYVHTWPSKMPMGNLAMVSSVLCYSDLIGKVWEWAVCKWCPFSRLCFCVAFCTLVLLRLPVLILLINFTWSWSFWGFPIYLIQQVSNVWFQESLTLLKITDEFLCM